MNITTILPRCFSILAVASILAQPTTAYEYPLSSTAIREAYFLGTGDPNHRILFAEKYVKRYAVPKSGEYVGLIDFETPYMVIAQEIAQKGDDYHAPDAVKDYLGKPSVCRVRVEIYWGLNSSTAVTGHPTRDQTDYSVRVTQDGKEIPVKAKWTEALVVGTSAPVDIGFASYREFDAENVKSAPTTVEVKSADGTVVSATFDLDSVR